MSEEVGGGGGTIQYRAEFRLVLHQKSLCSIAFSKSTSKVCITLVFFSLFIICVTKGTQISLKILVKRNVLPCMLSGEAFW